MCHVRLNAKLVRTDSPLVILIEGRGEDLKGKIVERVVLVLPNLSDSGDQIRFQDGAVVAHSQRLPLQRERMDWPPGVEHNKAVSLHLFFGECYARQLLQQLSVPYCAL